MALILLIEDNLSDRNIAEFLLKRAQHGITTSSDAFDAVDKIQRQKFDLIILDISLPYANGFEVLKRIRASELNKNTMVMMMSARSEAKDIRASMVGGAVDYIVKPIDPMIFDSKVKYLLEASDDWVSYQLPDNKSSQYSVSFNNQILSISELGVEFLSDLEMKAGTNIRLNIEALKEIGIPEISVQTSLCHPKENQYIVKAVFVGLRDFELQKIRVICRSLKPIAKLATS